MCEASTHNLKMCLTDNRPCVLGLVVVGLSTFAWADYGCDRLLTLDHFFRDRLCASTNVRGRVVNPHPGNAVHIGTEAETLWATSLGNVLYV